MIATHQSPKMYTKAQIAQLFDLPFMDLIMQAQTVHRQNFVANEVQISTLLSIKTGNCPEDCGYCSQSGHYRKKRDYLQKSYCKFKRLSLLRSKQKHRAHHVFAWGLHGSIQVIKTCLIWLS